MSLGSASFAITADPSQFAQAMSRAESRAKQMATSVSASVDQVARKFQVGFAPMGRSVEEVRERLHTFQVALPGMSRGMDQVEQSSRRLGYGFYAVGQAVDDLQYGFGAIVNNIPQIALLFGGSAGIAGAVAIAEVGISQLAKHWGDLTDAMNSAWSGKPIEELRKVREEADKAADAWERMSKAPTKLQARSARAIEEAIIEAPAEMMRKGIEDSLRQGPHGDALLTEGERAELAGRRRQLEWAQKHNPEGRLAGGSPREFQRMIDEIHRRAAERILGEARQPGAVGESATRNIQTMIREQPHLFPAEARAQFEAATPEGFKRQQEFERQLDVQARIRKQMEDRLARLRKETEEEADANRRMQAQRMAEEAARIAEGQKQAQAQREVTQVMESQKKREWDRLHHLAKDKEQADERAKHEAEHGRREQQQRATHARHLRQRVRDILEGARPERERTQFMGAAEFAKFTQTGALDKADDLRKKQLRALEQIRDLLMDNPNNLGTIMTAVAAGPP